MTDIYKNLKQLGKATWLPENPEAAVLEKAANPQAGTACRVRFTASGSPRFAR